MGVLALYQNLTPLDLAALILLFGAWVGLTWIVENPPASRPSTSSLMADYRRCWMQELVTRQPRIFDSQLIANMRQATAVFISASMIAIGGGFALLGNTDRLRDVAQDLTQSDLPVVVWEAKLIVILLFAANAFLKFVWSHRLFGYCSVIMAAVPNDIHDPAAPRMAEKAAQINITAARGFNRGLRSIYFGIGACAWLIGDWALILATVFTAGVILRREFASFSRAVLLSEDGRP
jgi:uncharacterized membrane protein